MNNDTLQGKWRQLRGNIKTVFGKLTDDDLLQADGNADKIMGKMQERYGYSKEQAQTEWDRFAQTQAGRAENAQTDLKAAGENLKKAADHVKDAAKR